MNLNDLTTEEIKDLLNIQKVLNALLDKINNVETQITHNRKQIDALTKNINELSSKILAMDISTNNELKQVKTDNTLINQKLFNMDKQLVTLSKQITDLGEVIGNLEVIDDDDENKEESKKKNFKTKAVKDLKKVNKK